MDGESLVLDARLAGNKSVRTYPFTHPEDREHLSIMCLFVRPSIPGKDEGTSVQTHISLSLEAATALAAQLRVHLARIAAP